MFNFGDKTKKSFKSIVNVNENCSCALDCKYTVYANVFQRYEIKLFYTTNNELTYNVCCHYIEVDKDTTVTPMTLLSFSSMELALQKYFEVCEYYKNLIHKTC